MRLSSIPPSTGTVRFANVFAENLANKLIGLIVTVAILAAVYFFAIKPILDTTNDAFDRAFDASDGITESIQESFDDAGVNGFDVNNAGLGNASAKQANQLLECIQKVQPNTTKMQNCVEKFQ